MAELNVSSASSQAAVQTAAAGWQPSLAVAAWAVMLAVSDLPDVLINSLGGQPPAWLFWAKTGLLAAFLGLTLAWRLLRPLWQYAAVFLTLHLALILTGLVRSTAWFQDRFNYSGVPFFKGYAAIFVLDIFAALLVLAALRLMKGSRREFFFVRGNPAAPIEPVRWLGIKPGESWKTFGWIFAGCAGLAVGVPTLVGTALPGETWLKALQLLPAAVILAAVNAFTEESYYRCSLLSTLVQPIGRRQALLLSVVYFGMAHWLYGSPPGLLGFLMVGFLAWLIGKSMLETKGFLWPWFIHLVPDVVIFFSYALMFVQQ